MSNLPDRRGSPRRQFPARKPISPKVVLLVCGAIAAATLLLMGAALVAIAAMLE